MTKPGIPRMERGKGGREGRTGREKGRGREGGARAKPGNQIVIHKLLGQLILTSFVYGAPT